MISLHNGNGHRPWCLTMTVGFILIALCSFVMHFSPFNITGIMGRLYWQIQRHLVNHLIEFLGDIAISEIHQRNIIEYSLHLFLQLK
jgi:hypothetical protein